MVRIERYAAAVATAKSRLTAFAKLLTPKSAVRLLADSRLLKLHPINAQLAIHGIKRLRRQIDESAILKR